MLIFEPLGVGGGVLRRAGAWPSARRSLASCAAVACGDGWAMCTRLRRAGGTDGRLVYVRGHLVAKNDTQCGLVWGQTGPRIVLKVYLLVIRIPN